MDAILEVILWILVGLGTLSGIVLCVAFGIFAIQAFSEDKDSPCESD